MFATLWFICNYPNRQQQQQDGKQQQRELCPQVARRGELMLQAICQGKCERKRSKRDKVSACWAALAVATATWPRLSFD